MNKKRLVATLAATTLISSAIPLMSQAVEANEQYPSPTTAITSNIINFSEDSGPGVPVDPTDPTKPILPVDPPNPAEGEFILTFAPNLDFGEQNPTESSWFAKGVALQDGTETAPFSSVKDTRGGDRKGWALQAKMETPFTNNAGKVLDGAELNFSKMVVASNVTGAPQVPTETVTLSTDASDLATADEKSGSGNWSIGFGKYNEESATTNGIELSVPQTSSKDKGAYTATINWELVADPTV